MNPGTRVRVTGGTKHGRVGVVAGPSVQRGKVRVTFSSGKTLGVFVRQLELAPEREGSPGNSPNPHRGFNPATFWA